MCCTSRITGRNNGVTANNRASRRASGDTSRSNRRTLSSPGSSGPTPSAAARTSSISRGSTALPPPVPVSIPANLAIDAGSSDATGIGRNPANRSGSRLRILRPASFSSRTRVSPDRSALTGSPGSARIAVPCHSSSGSTLTSPTGVCPLHSCNAAGARPSRHASATPSVSTTITRRPVGSPTSRTLRGRSRLQVIPTCTCKRGPSLSSVHTRTSRNAPRCASRPTSSRTVRSQIAIDAAPSTTTASSNHRSFTGRTTTCPRIDDRSTPHARASEIRRAVASSSTSKRHRDATRRRRGRSARASASAPGSALAPGVRNTSPPPSFPRDGASSVASAGGQLGGGVGSGGVGSSRRASARGSGRTSGRRCSAGCSVRGSGVGSFLPAASTVSPICSASHSASRSSSSDRSPGRAFRCRSRSAANDGSSALMVSPSTGAAALGRAYCHRRAGGCAARSATGRSP